MSDHHTPTLLRPAPDVLCGCKAPALSTPLRDRVDDPVDDLADARLALVAAKAAAEVLLGDDVDRQLGPGAGDLYVLLLEDDLAFLTCDGRRSSVPLHQVEGVAARRREEAPEVESLGFASMPVPVLGWSGPSEVG